MPTYGYKCKCGLKFDHTCSIHDYQDCVKCPQCKKTAKRNYEDITVQIIMEPTTLGSVAERNTSRMSKDEKAKLNREHNAYKTNAAHQMKLPDGASHLPVDVRGKPIAPTRQRKKDIRKHGKD